MDIIAKHQVDQVIKTIRINDYLIGVFEILPSRKSIKKAIQKGLIYADGKQAQSSLFIKKGMIIELIRESNKKISIYPLDLPVIYEDEELAVVNKPAGLVSSANQFRSLHNALPYNIQLSTQPDAITQPQLVHRLDSATSGLIIVAKTSKCLIKLGEMLKQGLITKKYLAIVVGEVQEEGIINSPIEEKEAVSEFKKIETIASSAFNFLSKVYLFPKTGRTHQLRIHMKVNETPILGDRIYSEQNNLLKGKGLFLSSVGLDFKHPIKEKAIKLEIDPPKKFEQYWEWTKKRKEMDN